MNGTDLPSFRVLLLPGWLDSDEAHWQSRWETLYGDRRVEQDDWQWPRRGDWMARLDEVVQADDTRPIVLVAHSLGCHLVAAWAAHSRHASRVHAAMLVAPPDTERADMPPQLYNWRPAVRASMPFACLALISDDDPYAEPDHAAALVNDWGGVAVRLGACGHVNAASGLGDWPEGRRRLREWLASLPPAGG